MTLSSEIKWTSSTLHSPSIRIRNKNVLRKGDHKWWCDLQNAVELFRLRHILVLWSFWFDNFVVIEHCHFNCSSLPGQWKIDFPWSSVVTWYFPLLLGATFKHKRTLIPLVHVLLLSVTWECTALSLIHHQTNWDTPTQRKRRTGQRWVGVPH